MRHLNGYEGGQLKVVIMQTYPVKGKDASGKEFWDENTTSMELTFTPKSSDITINQLAGTITNEVFATFEARRHGRANKGLSAFKANHPVRVKISTEDGNLLTDTIEIEKVYQTSMTLRSRAGFGLAMFAGLSMMGRKPELKQLTDIVKQESSKKFIGSMDKKAWANKVQAQIEAAPAE